MRGDWERKQQALAQQRLAIPALHHEDTWKDIKIYPAGNTPLMTSTYCMADLGRQG